MIRAVWLVVAFAPLAASAGVNWHPDLAAARAAAAKSRKPVLAVFTAAWSERGLQVENRALASDEAAAVVSACFEPVRLDVDAHAELTRKIGVVHVPTACVLASDDALVTSFECPEEPAAFVAAAARAAQDAALAAGNANAAPTAHPPRKVADVDAEAFGLPTRPLSGTRDANAQGRGAISLVTAKVRQLSEFGSGEPAGTSVSESVTPATTLADATPPQLPAQPVSSWPAETPSPGVAFTNAPQAPLGRQSIEPAAAPTAPNAAAAWLASTPPAAPAAAAPAVSALTAVPPPAAPDSKASVTDQPPPAAKKPSAWDGFVAAIQKPFSSFGKSDPKPQLPSAAVPPTMPPARPASPLGVAAATPPQTPAADATAAPDRYGSMPLGLEGYCPVTLADRGVWSEGRAQWGARHRGRTYLFAGPEQQQAFLANPDRYAPALSGDDPVLAFESGKSAPGRRAYGVTYQSRMYLFASPETRAAFTSNPDRYTARVMLAEKPAPSDAVRRY